MKLKTILIAEDNVKDVELTLEALAEHNLANEVVVVNDGAAALDYLYCRGKYASRANTNPAVVLLDLKMPKVDGLEVLAQIKADARLKSVPVVMLTSSREEQDLIESYKLGVNAYVVKPIDFSDFITAVKQLGFFWAVINEPPPRALTKQPEVKTALNILHLEDNGNDAALIEAAIEADGIACNTTRVESSPDFIAAIEKGGVDLILSDVSLPGFDGLAALRIALTKCPGVPFIFLSGTFSEELAVETLENGATDYVVKTDLTRIGPAVRRAVEKANERDQKRLTPSALAILDAGS